MPLLFPPCNDSFSGADFSPVSSLECLASPLESFDTCVSSWVIVQVASVEFPLAVLASLFNGLAHVHDFFQKEDNGFDEPLEESY